MITARIRNSAATAVVLMMAAAATAFAGNYKGAPWTPVQDQAELRAALAATGSSIAGAELRNVEVRSVGTGDGAARVVTWCGELREGDAYVPFVATKGLGTEVAAHAGGVKPMVMCKGTARHS